MIRKLARPMLASVYIADGVKTVTNASEYAGDAERVVEVAAAHGEARVTRLAGQRDQVCHRVLGVERVDR